MTRRDRGWFLGTAVLWSLAATGCATGSAGHGVGGMEAGRGVSPRTEAHGLGDTPPTVEELSRFVLVIRESSAGEVTHQWQRVETFSWPEPRAASQVARPKGTTVFAVAHPRDCHGEFLECNRKCMERPLPRGYGHMTKDRGKGAKEKYCREECWQPYMDCEELQGHERQEFSAVDAAVDWLSLHRETLLKGSLVLIAGVSFVAVSAGAGLVILAPLILLNSAEAPTGPALLARMPCE